MIGRGTRLFPGKNNLLVLDFLWLSYKHNLCKPASLITENDKDIETVAKASTSEEEEIDLLEAVSDAEGARRNALAQAIERNARKKSKLINPVELFAIINVLSYSIFSPL